MQNNNKEKMDKFVKVLLAVLVLAVIAQTCFIVKIYMGKKGEPANFADLPFSKAPITQAPQINPSSFFPPAPPANTNPYVNIAPSPLQQNKIQPHNSKLLPPFPANSASNAQTMPVPSSRFGMNAVSPQQMNQMIAWDDDDSFFGSDPFAQMEEMQAKMEQMMASMMQGRNSSFKSMSPGLGQMGGFDNSARISEKNGKYIVKMKIPGLDKSEIKTEVNGAMLTISGVQKEEVTNTVGGQIVSRGYNQSQFHNSMSLPGPVKSDDIKVNYNKDELTITIPKA